MNIDPIEIQSNLKQEIERVREKYQEAAYSAQSDPSKVKEVAKLRSTLGEMESRLKDMEAAIIGSERAAEMAEFERRRKDQLESIKRIRELSAERLEVCRKLVSHLDQAGQALTQADALEGKIFSELRGFPPESIDMARQQWGHFTNYMMRLGAVASNLGLRRLGPYFDRASTSEVRATKADGLIEFINAKHLRFIEYLETQLISKDRT